MIYGIDMGSGTKKVDWKLLKEKGVEFAVIKATQGDYRVNGNFPELAAGARQAGLAVGLYHWCDPLCDGGSQGEYFLDNTRTTEFDFAALDFEQYWADWKEWPGKIKKLLTSEQISRAGCITAKTIRDGIDTSRGSSTGGKRLLVYTRASFVRDFAAPASGWLAGYPLWIAHWLYPPGRVMLTWEELFIQEQANRLEPALPAGIKRWDLHQWSGDRFILPGMNGEKADLNRFNGSSDELRDWLGFPPQAAKDELLSRLEIEIERSRLQAAQLDQALRAYVESQKQCPQGGQTEHSS